MMSNNNNNVDYEIYGTSMGGSRVSLGEGGVIGRVGQVYQYGLTPPTPFFAAPNQSLPHFYYQRAANEVGNYAQVGGGEHKVNAGLQLSNNQSIASPNEQVIIED